MTVLWVRGAVLLVKYATVSFLKYQQLLGHSKYLQHFMETEGSLPCSQETSTGLYPEPDESSPIV
jgi:hypothetical protein